MQEIHVAHSPDSDDAFMFWALAKDRVDTEGLKFVHHLEDIQTLNEAAKQGKYELTAISYYAYPFVKDKYVLLTCGSSIGNKYGPVVVSKTAMTKDDLAGKTIAVPGEMTTAYLALKIWYPEAVTEVVPFDQIMAKVIDGTYSAGLLIHEGQLTYQQDGLCKIVDLGQWWFEETNLTLPLGGNAVRKDLGEETCIKIARVLKRSIDYALKNRQEALEYSKTFARGLNDTLLDRFISMYVNEMTVESDMEIQKGVKMLLLRGYGIGLVPEKSDVEFLGPDGAGSPLRKYDYNVAELSSRI